MPIRLTDPFRDPTINLRSEVNPFLEKMQSALHASSDLPLLFGPSMKPWSKQWRSWFAQEQQNPVEKLVVEVGCHKGEVLKKMASQHPDIGFIGLDITFKRVVHTANKATQAGLQNVLSLLCNARALDQVFGEEEVDGFVIFFPDPWVRKKRQQKNRLLDRDFFEQMLRCLKPGGFIWIKTDHEPYFLDICQHAEAVGFVDSGPQVNKIITETYTSRFEQHFLEAGEASFGRSWQKKAEQFRQANADLASGASSFQNESQQQT
ncbi:MAG: tRNA (guanosine(46)-N7)-methyltransferase TrmB [Oligoflexus sp.]